MKLSYRSGRDRFGLGFCIDNMVRGQLVAGDHSPRYMSMHCIQPEMFA